MTYICAPIFVDLPLDNGVTVEFSPSLAPVVPIPGGPKGLDGVSPIITVTDILGGHKVTITDKDGTETFDVMDGGISQEDFLKVFPQDFASGSVASFPDGADGVPVVELTVDITPVQSGSGDPSPSNVRPISGWSEAEITRTGKNWIDEEDVLYKLENPAQTVNSYRYTEPIYFAPNTQYFMSYSRLSATTTSTMYLLMRVYSGDNVAVTGPGTNKSIINNKTVQANFTFTTGTSGAVRFAIYHAGYSSHQAAIDNVRETITDWQIERGSSATLYEPYNGTNYTFDLDGTRYGGTLNVLTGVLTVTKANIASYAGEALPGEWISDRDVYAPGTTPTTGAQVVYELATPLTVQLTPAEVETLLGTNNIWSDTGNTTVKYRADTGLYVQKLTGSTEEDMTANVSIASGKYFMVGNTLYLSTTTIPAGDTIKPGTNCTLTNLAAALNALNA